VGQPRVRHLSRFEYRARDPGGGQRPTTDLAVLGFSLPTGASLASLTPAERGDLNYVVATGRAAREVFSLSSDGRGARIIGTAFNCVGATTSWQTVLCAGLIVISLSS
jgi:hypothetical protein